LPCGVGPTRLAGVIPRGQSRVVRAVLCAAVLAALAVVPATAAGAPALTWQQAAARLHAPVYRPRVTMGIKQQPLVINQGGCLIGAWGSAKTLKGPHFSIDEPGDTSQCGQPGEADEVATTVIHGKKVTVLVQCRHIPHCTVHDGETDGVYIMFVPEKGAKQYVIQLGSSHLSLANLEKVARSFVRVNAPRTPAARPAAVRHFSEFRSPDGEVWCGAGQTTFCGTGGAASDPAGGPQTLGSLAANGKVTLCRVAHSSVSTVCLQNWDDTAPKLEVGESTERNNIRCTSALAGITCTIASGPAKGRGFHINATTVQRIGPGGPPPPAVPILGDARAGSAGFGTAHPGLVALGNDIIGHVSKIHWRNWGAKQAKATGTGYWIPAGKPASQAQPAPAEVIAFDLGSCHGVRAYLKFEWWLPSLGGHFSAHNAFDACL
jgi:hypothetical protein